MFYSKLLLLPPRFGTLSLSPRSRISISLLCLSRLSLSPCPSPALSGGRGSTLFMNARLQFKATVLKPSDAVGVSGGGAAHAGPLRVQAAGAAQPLGPGPVPSHATEANSRNCSCRNRSWQPSRSPRQSQPKGILSACYCSGQLVSRPSGGSGAKSQLIGPNQLTGRACQVRLIVITKVPVSPRLTKVPKTHQVPVSRLKGQTCAGTFSSGARESSDFAKRLRQWGVL